MVQPMIPGGVADPKTALGNDAVIFGELLGHGAKVAIGGWRLSLTHLAITHISVELYQDRRKNWIEEEITDKARRLDDDCTRSAHAR